MLELGFANVTQNKQTKKSGFLHFAGIPGKRKIKTVQILSKLLTILVTFLFTDKSL